MRHHPVETGPHLLGQLLCEEHPGQALDKAYYKLKCFFALTLLASINLAEEFFSNYILQVKTVKPPDIMNDISGR